MAAKFLGLRSVEDSISELLKPISKKDKTKYILINNITKNWENIIGQQYSQFCQPKSINFDKSQANIGKLTIVAYNNSIAFFLKNNSEIILERISSLYGHKSIRKIIIKQEPKRVEIDNEEIFQNLPNDIENYVFDKIKDIENEELKQTLLKLAKTIF